VYDTVQVPDERVQDEGLNVPPRLPSLQVTVPAVIVGKVDVSMTLTVNDTEEPCFATPEFDVTVLEVESIVTVVLGTMDEFVLSETAVLKFALFEISVEIVLLETAVLELLELDSIEKAYCGKTSTAITERKSRILRFISHDSPYAVNKELIHIVQEQCYPCHE
jgi:hypothetical protein